MLKRSAIVLLGSAILWGMPVAAVQPQSSVHRDQVRMQMGMQRPLGPTVSFDFQGGTVAQYVAALRGATELPVNVAVVPRAADIQMPPIAMQQVALYEALSVIAAVANTPPNVRLDIVQLSRNTGDDAEPAFAVALQPGPPAPPTTLRTEVFSLHELLAVTLRAQTILTAVESTLDLEDDGNEARIRFHEESGLLLVRGTQGQISTVSRVIDELKRSGAARGQDEQQRRRRDDLNNARRELSELQERLVAASVRHEMSRIELSRVQASTHGTPSPENFEGLAQSMEAETRARIAVTTLNREADRLSRIVTEMELERYGLRDRSALNAPEGTKERSPAPQQGTPGR